MRHLIVIDQLLCAGEYDIDSAAIASQLISCLRIKPGCRGHRLGGYVMLANHLDRFEALLFDPISATVRLEAVDRACSLPSD